MSVLPPAFAALAPLLPEDRVGKVTAIEPIVMGLSGAEVYAVSSSRGPLVLRVQPARGDAEHWPQQLLILRRTSERGVAPAIVHVDEAARAVVSQRVAGVPLPAVLGDPTQRTSAMAGVVQQLRALRAVDPAGITPRDPLAQARATHATQRVRPGFPAWAAGLAPRFDAIGAALARDPRLVVSHNDLNPSNILWDGTRAWFVDWEVASLNHPFYDPATLATFLRLDEPSAHSLLEQLEGRPIGDTERATFAALRRLVALLAGLTCLGLVPELGLLPADAPTLAEFYAGLRAGQFDLQDPRGRGAFGLALLRTGAGGES
jgi:Ser/Thr protein kinase RdoA (MazF antagonist)